jgi:pimeloyl-ACP methyl ester carboxylesterase
VTLLGTRVLLWRWPLTRDERAGLLGATHDAYVEMRADVGGSPSPVANTLLARQSPVGFDTIVLEPKAPAPGVGLIFLHGYGGSFRLECWLAARAAGAIGAVTVCPATTLAGHWGSRDGERIVRATLDYLHGRGVRRVYLAGLSNGATGAVGLAPRLAASLAGLVVISGAPASGANAGLPTLVIHGERDTISSAAAAHTFATRTHSSYSGFEGGHFILLTQRSQIDAAIGDWLRRREAAAR